MKTRLGLSLVSTALALLLTGCPCGVGPVPSADVVNGVVTFDPATVGEPEQLDVLFQDSADVDETLLSASLSGADAADFQVLSTFPVYIPAGTQAMLEIQFTPSHTGSASATLQLQTKEMGISPVQLAGTGESQ
jgi:hypothetical protein